MLSRSHGDVVREDKRQQDVKNLLKVNINCCEPLTSSSHIKHKQKIRARTTVLQRILEGVPAL